MSKGLSRVAKVTPDEVYVILRMHYTTGKIENVREHSNAVLEIERSCGHFDEISVGYLQTYAGEHYIHQASKKKIDDTRNSACWECFYLEALTAAEVQGFPELCGTPAQVKWAVSLRHKAFLKFGEKTLTVIDLITESAWWIENKGRLSYAKIWSEYDEDVALAEDERFYQERLTQEAKRLEREAAK
ncbi:hypothetical protein [Micromonospora sp. WMMD1274]|uniref:hypothetical protein n=1 Tax=Micromonospora sp. WMMD1274 TaxID=3404116 RepID=UPI003B93192F